MFEEEIKDELGHASFLTDIIIDIGGEPTTTPKEFGKPGTIKEMLDMKYDELYDGVPDKRKKKFCDSKLYRYYLVKYDCPH